VYPFDPPDPEELSFELFEPLESSELFELFEFPDPEDDVPVQVSVKIPFLPWQTNPFLVQPLLFWLSFDLEFWHVPFLPELLLLFELLLATHDQPEPHRDSQSSVLVEQLCAWSEQSWFSSLHLPVFLLQPP
jgi:hypothetical protein